MANALDCWSTPPLDGQDGIDKIRYSPDACSCLTLTNYKPPTAGKCITRGAASAHE